MPKTKLAILDLDNTLYDGTIGIDALKRLISLGHFDKKTGEEIVRLRNQYRDNIISRAEVFDRLHPLYAEGLIGRKKSVVEQVSQTTFEKVQSKFFAYVPTFIQLLKKYGYTIVVLSGSGDEAVQPFVRHYDLAYGCGVCVESKQGLYTGVITSIPSTADKKMELISDYLARENITVDWGSSLAIGDSISESLFFDHVGIPLVFEPHPSFATEVELHPSRIQVDRRSVMSKTIQAIASLPSLS